MTQCETCQSSFDGTCGGANHVTGCDHYQPLANHGYHDLDYKPGREAGDSRYTCLKCGRSASARSCFDGVDCVEQLEVVGEQQLLEVLA